MRTWRANFFFSSFFSTLFKVLEDKYITEAMIYGKNKSQGHLNRPVDKTKNLN